MASVPQSSWFCTVRPSSVSLYSMKANPRNLPFKTLKVSSSSSNAEPSPSISSNPPENSSAVEPSKSDRLKLAFDKAKEYKESLKSNPTPKIVPNPVPEYAVTGSENGEPIDGVPLSVRIAMEEGKGYKENKDVVVGSSGMADKGEAFSGTKKNGFVSEVKTVDNQELPPSVKLAMEKAKEFQNKGVMSSGEGVEDIRTISEGDFPEVEILDGAPSKYGKTAASEPKSVEDDNKPKVSTWGTAPSPRNLSKTEGDLPEVEILVGDTTKFGAVRASEPKTIEEEDPDVYKPKVSTWGDSPSPRNISKAQGDFPEVEILVGDPRKFRTTAASEPESIDEYKPTVSTHGASPSSRNISKTEGDFPEVEILVGDPSKFETFRVSKPKTTEKDNPEVYKTEVSTWGASPSPINISKTERDFPEVEILVGDPSKFGTATVSEPKSTEEDDLDVYNPKVSSWGASSSPRNISKTEGDLPEIEILVGDPSKSGTRVVSEPKSIEKIDIPKVSTSRAPPSPRNISKTEGDIPEVEILVGDPSKFGTATVSKPKSTEEDDLDVYRPKVSTWGASPSPTNISETEGDFPEVEILVGDPSKFGKAAVSNSKSIEKVYNPKGSTSGDSPSPRNMSHTEEDDFPEVEMIVGDPRKLGTTTVSEPNTTKEDNREVFKPKVSTLDASPSPRKILKMEGHFSEAEILAGKPTKFGTVTVSEPKTIEEDDPDIYKPNVSTWGVFPRPRNISKAYGGGRVIRPGEVLETAEVKAAKDVRTRELVAAYRRKTESSIDPKLKSECEEALKDGDSLMDIGKLKEALPFYETVMYKIPFESELHGLAALHWAICQDSLTRHKEARVMYGKLSLCLAMAMLKVKSTTLDPINLGYQNYFDAFVEDKASYPLKDAEVEEGALKQALPYFIFLASPIIIVLLIALQKRI